LNKRLGMLKEAQLGQGAVSQTAVNECTGQFLGVKLVWESEFNPAGLVKHPYLLSAETVKSKLGRLSSNWESFRAPMMRMTRTGRQRSHASATWATLRPA